MVFAAKTSCENWAQLLIVDEKKLLASTASQFISAFETGGFVASFATGYLTDIFVRKFVSNFIQTATVFFFFYIDASSILQPVTKGGSPRMILVLFYMVLSTVALFLLTNFNVKISTKGFVAL